MALCDAGMPRSDDVSGFYRCRKVEQQSHGCRTGGDSFWIASDSRRKCCVAFFRERLADVGVFVGEFFFVLEVSRWTEGNGLVRDIGTVFLAGAVIERDYGCFSGADCWVRCAVSSWARRGRFTTGLGSFQKWSCIHSLFCRSGGLSRGAELDAPRAGATDRAAELANDDSYSSIDLVVRCEASAVADLL